MRTLRDQAEAVRRREVSPVELVERALEALAAAEIATNAFTHVLPERALERARTLEGADPVGPLHGVPIVIKELFDVEGVPTTGCCAAFEGRVATEDSVVVSKLRAAGAIVISKSNQHQMACGATGLLSSFGPVRNPWDHDRIPGGSSGGSAAAVATGVVAAAMGSDTGGSVRIPAAFCGISGLKTTHGAVSLRGAMPLTPSLDTAGPLAATADDCRLVFEVISGFDPDDAWSQRAQPPEPGSVRGARVAVLRAFCDMAHPDLRAAVEAAAKTLESLGARIEEIDGPDPDVAWAAMGPVFVTEFAACYPRLHEDRRVHPEVRSLLEAGANTPGTVYFESLRVCRAVRRAFDAALADADVLIAPAVPYPAPRVNEESVDVGGRTIDVGSGGPARLTMPVNVAGLPALALPVGRTADDLPLGAQLIGRHWSEAQLCSIGGAFQGTTDWHDRVAPVS